ncbi:MAG TPA: hypothetical protein VGN34_07950 [Ktedonobacteraceae bacterium]|jgi:hypothetical protein
MDKLGEEQAEWYRSARTIDCPCGVGSILAGVGWYTPVVYNPEDQVEDVAEAIQSIRARRELRRTIP